MHTPPEPTTPSPGTTPTPAAPALNTHRLQLHEAQQTARVSIHPPLDVGTLAELAHLLDSWSAPTDLKAFVLDLSACASIANTASADGAAPRACSRGDRGACANAR